MFKITCNAKHGGIWDADKKRVVKEFETDNAALAEQFAAQGCTVEEVEVPLDKLNVTQLKKYASELKAGDLVFHHNGTKIHHVGVYIGDNMVIHAKGRDVGVVKEKFSTNDWNRFGRYEKLQESEETKMKIITKTSPLMKGEDIKALQKALNALWYDCRAADGIAVYKTINAIQAFVDKHTAQKLPDSVIVTVNVGKKTYIGTLHQ